MAGPPHSATEQHEELHPEQDKVSSTMDEETTKEIMAAPGMLICPTIYSPPSPSSA